jgi:hypothetical protein
MMSERLSDQSDQLAVELLAVIDLPLVDGSVRVRVSDVACSMSLEHWHAARVLFRGGLLPSGLVVHRAQFEAVVRSIWIVYAASEESIAKLSDVLTLDSEQAAKNLPQLAEMMDALSKRGPPQAHDALSRFKTNSWKALNSYAHAGIHPLRRHEEGYPLSLLGDVLRGSNGLGLISCMHAAGLSGRQPLQQELLAIAARHPDCMPPPL